VLIPTEHSPITVDDVVYDLSHLSTFSAAIPGKGIVDGTDLEVIVVFSNHVYTERTKQGGSHHTVDHHGTKRTFDVDRYKMSRTLIYAIKGSILANSLTHISKSYGGIDNLVFVKTADGRKWAAVYCLVPLDDGCSVRMEVLSCHPKVIDQKSTSRRNLSYFARMCLYRKTRIPKT
jgi:hypothetical protein